jgi:hypothetical protein
MTLKTIGKSTSKVDVLNISKNGIWLLADNTEYFLPYKDFPWFKEAKISEIYKVKLTHRHHLHWPDLDVDLELESLQNLEKYPLVYC